jgi:hypothetical protein
MNKKVMTNNNHGNMQFISGLNFFSTGFMFFNPSDLKKKQYANKYKI